MGESSHCPGCNCRNEWSDTPVRGRVIDSNEYYDFVLSDDEETIHVVKTRRVEDE